MLTDIEERLYEHYSKAKKAPNQSPALELHSKAAPNVEAHKCVNGPDTGKNSGGGQIKKSFLLSGILFAISHTLLSSILLTHWTKRLACPDIDAKKI